MTMAQEKAGRVKSKKTRKLAAQSIQEEDFVREALLPLIKEILFEKFGYGRGDYSSQEREQYAQYLPSKNFPSLQDFGAMPDPEKSKNYWLNKGELDGDKKDDQLSPTLGSWEPVSFTLHKTEYTPTKLGGSY